MIAGQRLASMKRAIGGAKNTTIQPVTKPVAQKPMTPVNPRLQPRKPNQTMGALTAKPANPVVKPNVPKPSGNTFQTMSASPKFGYGNAAQNGGVGVKFTDKNAEIDRTMSVIQERLKAGIDTSKQMFHYKNLTGKDYNGGNTYTTPGFVDPPASAKRNPLLDRELGLGNGTDMNFKDWDNYDAVMNQLNAVTTALGVLNRDNSLDMSDMSDIYDHYLKTHARAKELGYQGSMAPGFVTGFVDPNDERYNGFRSITERGFDPYTAIDNQWEKYYGKIGNQSKNQFTYTPDESIGGRYSQQPAQNVYTPQVEPVQQGTPQHAQVTNAYMARMKQLFDQMMRGV